MDFFISLFKLKERKEEEQKTLNPKPSFSPYSPPMAPISLSLPSPCLSPSLTPLTVPLSHSSHTLSLPFTTRATTTPPPSFSSSSIKELSKYP